MAEKGFYTWQAAHNILRIIKVSCSCRIMHIIMARGFTLMCLGGGYYFRMCIHIWMEFEVFCPDQNDIHRKGPWTIIPASSLWVIKWWEKKISSNSAGIFETDLEEHFFLSLTSWLYIYKLRLFTFRWVLWAPCSPQRWESWGAARLSCVQGWGVLHWGCCVWAAAFRHPVPGRTFASRRDFRPELWEQLGKCKWNCSICIP